MIAIPDFAAGAMENWGLITYRETALLYKDGVSANSNKQRIAMVVSHELAHQWFGKKIWFKTSQQQIIYTKYTQNIHIQIFMLTCRELGHPIMVDRSLVEWGICKLCWISWSWGSTASVKIIRTVYYKWYAGSFPDRCSRHLASDLNPRETPRWNQWNIWPHFVRQR